MTTDFLRPGDRRAFGKRQPALCKGRNRISNDGFKNVSLTIAHTMLTLRAFRYEVIALMLGFLYLTV
jgi:hypothetical protein